MQLRHLVLATLAACSLQAHADTVALWDYNATPTTTKHTQSANGASFALVGGTTNTFAAGVTGQALNTTNYALQGTGNLTRGVEFMVDTTGYTDITLSFAQRNSGTASAWTTLLYTLDAGSTWTPVSSFQMTTTNFVTTLGYSFEAVTGADNNADFGIRLLATFAPGTSAYAGTTSAYPTTGTTGTTGTIRYDNVLFSGTAIPDPVVEVPEPGSYALLLAGLGLLTLAARRRSAR